MKKYFSPGLSIMFVVTAVCYVLFYLRPDLAFRVQTNGVFALIRRLYTGMSSIWVSLLWIVIFISYFKYRHSRGAPPSLFRWIKYLFEPVLWIFTLYFWLWGFNYLAPRPEHFLLKDTSAPDSRELLEAFHFHTNLVNTLRDSLDLKKEITVRDILTTHGEHWQRQTVSTLAQAGYNGSGKPEIQVVRPEGLLLRISTAGFYNFVLARPTIDPGLHELQVPNTALHELAHAYGVASEASASFVAYIVGIQSEDPLTRYSVELALWRTLRNTCFMVDSAATKTISGFVNPEVKKDIKNIRMKMDQYPDLFPRLRDSLYDFFLRTQGVEEGLMSYDLYLPLVLSWEKQKKLREIKNN